jgi:3-hydroxyacyl-[acyl-carrier-protein] dehydratase
MKSSPLLLNDLYTIKEKQEIAGEGKTNVKIEINSGHPIFAGHFPGNPLLPGVCTVQIIKELATYCLQKELDLVKAGNIKFLSFINPIVNPVIWVSLQLKETETGQYNCQASVHHEATVFCSFKGEFVSS